MSGRRDSSAQKVLWGLGVGQQPDRPEASLVKLVKGRITFCRGREENSQVVSPLQTRRNSSQSCKGQELGRSALRHGSFTHLQGTGQLGQSEGAAAH